MSHGYTRTGDFFEVPVHFSRIFDRATRAEVWSGYACFEHVGMPYYPRLEPDE
jgi:hypothetical protein